MSEGTPTVSFVGKHGEKMLPWHAFNEGNLNGDATLITLKFHGWSIRLEGHGLGVLWESLRQQDVVAIDARADPSECSECSITSIVVRPEGEVDDLPAE
ncbi:MAG: hypothetical protein KDN22_33635 [Verrucomicrobiae bacterium]|nr:hypothetical protein [Verrucomicrobiae bacterium]